MIKGEVGCTAVDIMLDSGSSVSLLRNQDIEHMKQVQPLEKTSEVKFVTASGDSLPIIIHVQAPVQVGNFRTMHHFVVAGCSIYPVILGINFLQQNELTLDFTSIPVSVKHNDI